MSRYESTGQVALLLAGATLASLLLIVLFTGETKSRRQPSRELAAEGEGSELSSPLRHHVTRLRGEERRAEGGGAPFGGELRRAKRGLGWGGGEGRSGRPSGMEVSRDGDDEEEEEAHHPLPQTTTPRPRHALRHRHRQHSRHRQATTPRTLHTTPFPSPSASFPSPGAREEVATGGSGVVAAPPPSPPDAGPAASGAATTSSGEEEEGVSSSPSRDGHAACYGPDQVVLIIALTCALNFACIFLVMALVHICNRNRKCASSGCDSPLLLVDSDYEADAKSCLGAAVAGAGAGASTSAEDDEDDDEELDEDAEELEGLLLAKRSFAPFLHSHHALAPGGGFRHPPPPPWRPTSFLGASTPLFLGGERRRCGPMLPSSSIAVGGASITGPAASSTCRPLLPPAAFSMEDLHILE